MIDEKIYDYVKSKLKKKRFIHTQGVQYTASCLAMRYNCDLNKAELAGFLHDVAKNLDDDELIKFCEKKSIKIKKFHRASPFLLHGPVGSYIAEHELGIKDKDILNAIANHTTGRTKMSLLEKIVFIADYIEPGRDKAPNLETIRKLAFEDIDKCIVMVYENTFSYINETQGKLKIDPISLKAYEYYKDMVSESYE